MPTTRYVIEITHDNEPVDELLPTRVLMSMTLDALRPSDEDDIDVGVTGVRVIKEPTE